MNEKKVYGIQQFEEGDVICLVDVKPYTTNWLLETYKTPKFKTVLGGAKKCIDGIDDLGRPTRLFGDRGVWVKVYDEVEEDITEWL